MPLAITLILCVCVCVCVCVVYKGRFSHYLCHVLFGHLLFLGRYGDSWYGSDNQNFTEYLDTMLACSSYPIELPWGSYAWQLTDYNFQTLSAVAFSEFPKTSLTPERLTCLPEGSKMQVGLEGFTALIHNSVLKFPFTLMGQEEDL